MLTNSDNDIAEALARQTALASGQPASFEGAEKAVTARLAALGVDVSGSRFADGSGLGRSDKVSAGLLTGLLAKAADPERPELRPVLTGLPVAGFTGTLRSRNAYSSPAALPAPRQDRHPDRRELPRGHRRRPVRPTPRLRLPDREQCRRPGRREEPRQAGRGGGRHSVGGPRKGWSTYG